MMVLMALVILQLTLVVLSINAAAKDIVAAIREGEQR